MVLPFLFLLWLILGTAGLEQAKNLAGGVLRLIQIRLTTPSLPKIVRVCQDNSPRLRIADSSSKNAVSFSSARTTKRFPSPRCASAIQIMRPSEAKAETQPQLQPALPRLSAMISQFFTPGACALLIVLSHLWCRFARVKLCAHFLDLRCCGRLRAN